jgi:hypothetical protein
MTPPRLGLHGCLLLGVIAQPAAAVADELLAGPYLQHVTPSEAWILWEKGEGGADEVRWGADEGLGSEAAAAVVDGAIVEAQLAGLQPDTRYHYAVGDDPDAVGIFRTPPADREASFRFAAVSDMQRDGSQPDKWGEIVHDGIATLVAGSFGPELDGELAFVLLAGDLVDNGWQQEQWRDEFLAPAHELMARVPFYPVYGNHEANTDLYRHYFHLPANGTEGLEEHWWFLDRGNTRVIGLDSNFPYATEPQLEWLQGVLDEACVDDDLDFVISQLHHPFLSEVWPPGELDFTGQVIELLDTFSTTCGKPAVHLFGHTHAYSRGQSRDHVHLWVNVASAGGRLDAWGEYDQEDYAEFSVSQSEYGFVVFDVTAGEDPALQMKRYSRGTPADPLDNVVRDQVEIRRYNLAPATPEARSPAAGVQIPPDCVPLVASPWCDPDGDLHGATRWQVAGGCEDFSAPVLDRWLQHENWYEGVDRQAGDHLGDELIESLDADAAYCWRVRQRDRGLVWSAWSEPVAFSTSASTLSANLLLNPGGEQGTDSWESLAGPLESVTDGECEGIAPHGGTRYLVVGGLCVAGVDSAEARQRVDLSAEAAAIDAGQLTVRFGGMLSDYDRDDLPEIQLAFLDGEGAELGRSERLGAAVAGWTRYVGHASLPAGTRAVDLHLFGTRNGGIDNDSYFDDLELRTAADGALAACLAPPAYPHDDEPVDCDPPADDDDDDVSADDDDSAGEPDDCSCGVSGTTGAPVAGLLLVWLLSRAARRRTIRR